MVFDWLGKMALTMSSLFESEYKSVIHQTCDEEDNLISSHASSSPASHSLCMIFIILIDLDKLGVQMKVFQLVKENDFTNAKLDYSKITVNMIKGERDVKRGGILIVPFIRL